MDPHKKVFVNEIRKVHKDLRRKYQKDPNFSKIWEEHCNNDELLNKYAKSMQDLATSIWDEDCDGTHRIKWCVDTCKSYFHGGEMKKFLDKDERRKIHYEKDPSQFHRGPNPFESFTDEDVSERASCPTDKLRLIDVGSCYDPFRKYEEFDTTAVDLKPASENVHKCDFIKVNVSSESEVEKKFEDILKTLSSSQQAADIDSLPSSYFHIVIFSLLLTYIPSPQVRWEICRKAHKVLQTNGLLLIITPDSSHQNKNAALMKRWKNAIEQIGFQRIKYSKDRHLHFMTFMKVAADYLWDKRKISEIYSNKTEKLCLNIPQDFHDCDDDTTNDNNDITISTTDITKNNNDVTNENDGITNGTSDVTKNYNDVTNDSNGITNGTSDATNSNSNVTKGDDVDVATSFNNNDATSFSNDVIKEDNSIDNDSVILIKTDCDVTKPDHINNGVIKE